MSALVQILLLPERLFCLVYLSLIRSWECGEVGHYVVEMNCDDYFDLEHEPSVHSTIHGEKIRYLCSVTKPSNLRVKRDPKVAKKQLAK